MLTGQFPRTGMSVSHSHVRTKRKLVPNLHRKRYWVPSENRFVRLRVSAKAVRIIDKIGIEEALKTIRERGVKV